MNQKRITLASLIVILILILAYTIGRVYLDHPQTGDSSKRSEDAAQSEIPLSRGETEKAISDPISKRALVEQTESENVPIDEDVRHLIASGSGVSLAGTCGYDRVSMSDNLELALSLRKATDRFDLTDTQIQALSELENRCSQFLKALDEESSLVPAIKQQEESLKRFYDALTTGISTTGWNDMLRDESLNALSSDSPAHTAMGAMHLLMYDSATQNAIAEYLGTKDLGYISSMSPGVAMLMECRMEGNCGRNSFGALRNCVMTDVSFCNGIQQGLSEIRTYGQYEDMVTVANFLMDVVKQ